MRSTFAANRSILRDNRSDSLSEILTVFRDGTRFTAHKMHNQTRRTQNPEREALGFSQAGPGLTRAM